MAILIVALLPASSLLARQATDMVVMKNGDRLTCEVKRLDGGVLYLGLDYVDGTISVQWAKVERINSSYLFLVRTQDGSVHTGKLTTPQATPGHAVNFEIIDEDQQHTLVDSTQIVDVRQTSNDFRHRFSVDTSFGATYAKGNNATQYTFGTQVTYQRERWAAQSGLNSNLSSNSGTSASTRNMMTLSAYHFLPWENYFSGALANFLQSSVQGISLQTSLGAGIGRFFKNTNRTSISVLAGAALQTTTYNQSDIQQARQNAAAWVIAADVRLFKFKKTNLRMTADVFPVIAEPGRVRANMNASYYLKIVGDLSWTLSIYGNWDTRPPIHFSGSDYGSSSGLTWTFNK